MAPALALTTAAQQLAAERVRAAGAERGVVELVASVPLAGRGGVDSDRVDDRELLRACVTALAYLARQLPPPVPQRAPRARWFRRAPAPAYVEAPVDELVAADWQRRVRGGSGVRWRRVWDALHAAGRLPRLQIEGPLVLDPVGTDLLRRVNQSLGSAPVEVRRHAARIVPVRPGAALGAPAAHLEWAVAQAGREGLVVPSTDPARPRRVPVAWTLARAIEELTTCG